MNKKAKSAAEVVAGWPAELQEIFTAIQAALHEFDPSLEERAAWAGVGYKAGSNYVCTVYPGREGLNIMIMRGIMLNDPKKMLDGSGVNTRNFRVASLDRFDEPYLLGLLAEQKKLFASGVGWE